MRSTILSALVFSMALAVTIPAQQGALQTAGTTLGVANIKSIQFVGAGRNFSVGQNYIASDPWPAVTVKNYTATINYDTASMRVNLLREMGAAGAARRRRAVHGRTAADQLVTATTRNTAPAPNAPAGGRAQRRPMRAHSRNVCSRCGPPQGFVKPRWPTTPRRGRMAARKRPSPSAAVQMVGCSTRGQVEKVQT
jgi:hypothetical protein